MSEIRARGDMLAGVMADVVARQLAVQGQADEIALFLTESPGPPDAPCPHCGAMLPYRRIEDPYGNFIVWSLFPEPCTNPACVEIARAEEEARERAEAERAAAEHEQLVQNALRISGVPRSYAKSSFATFDPAGSAILAKARDEAFAYAKNFARHREDGTGLFLCGNVGTGKTHLAAAVVRYIAERGIYSTMFTSSMDLLDALKESYDGGSRGPSETDILKQCKQAALLVIDDLGKEYGTAWAMTRLSDIIHARYADGLPMIVTSNYALSDIGNALAQNGAKSSADAIVSRLAERLKQVTVVGNDYRFSR